MAVDRLGLALQSQRFTGAGPHDFVLSEDIPVGCDALGITITMLDVNANPDPVQKVEFEQGAAFVEATRVEYRRRSLGKTYGYQGVAPDTGSGKTIRVTLNFAVGSGYRVTVYRLTGVDQTTPIELFAAADSASSAPLSLEGAPFAADPDGYFIGATTAHSNVSSWAAGGGPVIDHEYTNDSGGYGHCVMSDKDPLASGYDPTIDQGTTTRSLSYIGMWFRAATGPPLPDPPVIGEVSAAHDTEADIPVTTPGANADNHQLYARKDGGAWVANGPVLGATPDPVLKATGLDPDSDYDFKLEATNATGSTDSNVVSTTTAPARPTTMTVSGPTRTTLDYEPGGGDVGTVDVWTEVQLKLLQALPALELALRAHTYSGTGPWVDESGQGYEASPVGSPTWDGTKWTLNGTSQYFTIPDAVGLNFGDGDDITLIVVAACAVASPGNHDRLAGKGDNYYLNNHGSNPYGRAVVRGVTSGTSSSDTPDITPGRVSSFILQRDWGERRIRSWLDGQPGADNNDGTQGGFVNAEPFAIGAQVVGGTPTLHFEGDIYGVALARGLLSEAEMYVTTLYLLGQVPQWGDSKDHPWDVTYPQTAVNLFEAAPYSFKARNYRLGGWKSGWSPEDQGTTTTEGDGTLTVPASMRLEVGGEVTVPASMRLEVGGEVTVPASMRIRTPGEVLSVQASMNIAIPDVLPELGVGVPMTPN